MSSNTLSDFNADELIAPSWLNEEFFATVIQKCENSDSSVDVIDVTISPATKKGDHYASVMFRAQVSYKLNGATETKCKSLIVKTMPEEDGIKKELLKESYVFETEIGMYTEVLPRFEQILREIGDNTQLCAKCLHHGLNPYKFMIFEDIVPMGYKVLSSRQCNFEEAQVTYTKLAKWQAISYKLSLEEPDFLDKYRHSFMDLPNAESQEFLTDGVKNFMQMINIQPGFENYKKYFESLSGDLMKNMAASFREYRENRRDDGLYVLVHGDFHAKNVMMKWNEDSGALEDVMLLDFQMSNMGPITVDLQYGMYCMIAPEVRAKHADELLYMYHETFADTLKKIGFSGTVPSMWKLRKELFRQRMCELFVLMSFLPLWYLIMDPDFDPATMVESSDYRQSAYSNTAFLTELKKLLPQYLFRGYLDNAIEN